MDQVGDVRSGCPHQAQDILAGETHNLLGRTETSLQDSLRNATTPLAVHPAALSQGTGGPATVASAQDPDSTEALPVAGVMSPSTRVHDPTTKATIQGATTVTVDELAEQRCTPILSTTPCVQTLQLQPIQLEEDCLTR